VVALDGSPAAAAAFSVACPVAAQLGTGVEVLHVAAAPVVAEGLADLLHVPPELRTVTAHLELGDPVQELIRVADDTAVPLLVLTTHGREVEGPQHLTSVARAVAARAQGPILLVHPEMASKRSPATPLQHFLVPFEGSGKTAAALGPAMTLIARIGGGDGIWLDLLQVVHPRQLPLAERGSLSPPFYVDQPQHEWPAWRQRVIRWLRESCRAVPAQAPVRVFLTPAAAAGEVGAAIAAFAAEHGEDLIIVVRRSHLEKGRGLVLGKVLELTPCPVLLVGASVDGNDGLATPAQARHSQSQPGG
jgi:nucleotide-binding universal stress UspA family protein